MTTSVNKNLKEGSLIFLHIPKSAGRTLKSVIDRQFNRNTVYSIGGNIRQSIQAFKELPEEERKKFRFVRGHMYFGLHEYLKKPCHYITILRDPIDRVISHYYYVLRSPDHYLHNEIKLKKLSLEDYVSNNLSTELENGQTRLISGIESDKKATFEMLEIAKRNISTWFISVGVVEKFDESLILMKRILGWKHIFYIKGNVNPRHNARKAAPESTIRLIQSRNELDMKLYAFTKKRFYEAIQKQSFTFQSEIKLFRLMNRFYGIFSRYF